MHDMEAATVFEWDSEGPGVALTVVAREADSATLVPLVSVTVPVLLVDTGNDADRLCDWDTDVVALAVRVAELVPESLADGVELAGKSRMSNGAGTWTPFT